MFTEVAVALLIAIASGSAAANSSSTTVVVPDVQESASGTEPEELDYSSWSASSQQLPSRSSPPPKLKPQQAQGTVKDNKQLVCGEKACPPETAFLTYSCCGVGRRRCCDNFKLWVYGLCVVAEVLLSAALVVGVLFLLCCYGQLRAERLAKIRREGERGRCGYLWDDAEGTKMRTTKTATGKSSTMKPPTGKQQSLAEPISKSVKRSPSRDSASPVKLNAARSKQGLAGVNVNTASSKNPAAVATIAKILVAQTSTKKTPGAETTTKTTSPTEASTKKSPAAEASTKTAPAAKVNITLSAETSKKKAPAAETITKESPIAEESTEKSPTPETSAKKIPIAVSSASMNAAVAVNVIKSPATAASVSKTAAAEVSVSKSAAAAVSAKKSVDVMSVQNSRMAL